MRATDGNSQTWPLRAPDRRRLLSALVGASIVFALSIGVFLLIRRMTGSLTGPLPMPQLVATAAGLCVWAMLVYSLANLKQVVGLLLCVLLLFAIGCSYPATRFVDWLIWLPAIAIVAGLPFADQLKPQVKRSRSVESRQPVSDEVEHPEQVLQQLTRVRTAEGKDAVRGTVIAEFAPGERQTSLYVGFCPPFEMQPQVELNVTGDFEADVKLAQILHNGAQLDVRLSEPAEETLAITVEFFATEGQ
jgi:hypothetical protein